MIKLLRGAVAIFGLLLILNSGLLTVVRAGAEVPAFVAYHARDNNIYIVWAGTGETLQVTQNNYLSALPMWSGDGSWIAYQAIIRGVGVKVELVRPSGHNQHPALPEPRELERLFGWVPESLGGGLLIGADLPSEDVRLRHALVRKIPEGNSVILATGLNAARYAMISPESDVIVYDSVLMGNGELFALNLGDFGDVFEQINVTNHPSEDFFETLSPDGEYIVFTSWRDRQRDLYITQDDGTDVRRLTNSPEAEGFVQWVDDWIYFSAVSDAAETTYYKVRPDASEMTQITRDAFPRSSTIVGDWVSYVEDGTLFRERRDGSDRLALAKELPDTQNALSWSPFFDAQALSSLVVGIVSIALAALQKFWQTLMKIV